MDDVDADWQSAQYEEKKETHEKEGVSKIDSGFFISQKLPKIIQKIFIFVNN